MDANALDEPARQVLRRYRRVSWRWLIAGLALFIGFAAAAVVVEGRAEGLEQNGVRVVGHVEEVRGQGEGGSVVVVFEWAGHEWTEVVHLDAESLTYAEGQVVTVYLDPSDPEHASLPGETNQSPWTVWPMIIALVGSVFMVIVATVGLLRTRRQERHLSRTVWRRFPMRYAELRSGRSSQAFLLLGGPDAVLLAVASTTSPWRLGRSGLRDALELEVAGDPYGYVLVRGPGSGELFSARPPRVKRVDQTRPASVRRGGVVERYSWPVTMAARKAASTWSASPAM